MTDLTLSSGRRFLKSELPNIKNGSQTSRTKRRRRTRNDTRQETKTENGDGPSQDTIGPQINEEKKKNQVVLLEKDKMLSPGLFKIQISQSDTHFFITADRVYGGENYIIELQNDQIEQILEEF